MAVKKDGKNWIWVPCPTCYGGRYGTIRKCPLCKGKKKIKVPDE